MSRIFISYRRDDSAADMTDRLYERLAQRWGRRVFMDIDSLVGGDVFEKAIEENLQNCSVMLVIIGRQWASLTNENGVRRIDDPRDYPRMEVAAALRRGVRVIPVLVGDAEPPKREELPHEIAGLVDRQYVRVSRERFAADVQRLIEAVASEMPRESWWQQPWKAAAVAATVVLVAGTTAYFALVDDEHSRSGVPSVAVAPGPPAKPDAADVPADAAPLPESVAPPNAAKDEKTPREKPSKVAASRGADQAVASVDISGRWGTAPIPSAYSNSNFTLQFDFTQVDDTVLGTVMETYEGASRSVNRAIHEGKIKKNVISFHTKGEVLSGRTTVPYKQMYLGTLRKDGGEIAFRRFNDVSTGGEIETFAATR